MSAPERSRLRTHSARPLSAIVKPLARGFVTIDGLVLAGFDEAARAGGKDTEEAAKPPGAQPIQEAGGSPHP